MTRAGKFKVILKPIRRLKLGRSGGAATSPRQKAERNRCRGGRAAWMPREACGAMDGPSRRAPGATMEGGNRGEAGAGCRGKTFASFGWCGIPTTAKGSRPARRNMNIHRAR
ncbi:hypothetical protein E8E91_02555 [Pseudomonas sp. BN515]|nr:hypothetical protein [Pseudomonas sp. BN515]